MDNVSKRLSKIGLVLLASLLAPSAYGRDLGVRADDVAARWSGRPRIEGSLGALFPFADIWQKTSVSIAQGNAASPVSLNPMLFANRTGRDAAQALRALVDTNGYRSQLATEPVKNNYDQMVASLRARSQWIAALSEDEIFELWLVSNALARTQPPSDGVLQRCLWPLCP